MVDALPLVVGRYALCGELGSGGMGTVYVGRLAGPHGFSRTVAIKRMHPHLAGDPVFRRLFLDEARLAARVAHANVVATLDVVHQDDELLVVLEYVAGGSLASLLRAVGRKGARLPLKVVGTIVSQMLHGLHAVHEARDDAGRPLGLIHRDVAPDNVLVGSDGVARVIDFGIAKATELGRRTTDNRVKGKIRYMAPEHLRGEAIDRRADVYAAGSVLFEALTGRALLAGSNDVEQLASYRELDRTKKRPSAVVPSLPRSIDDLVERALSFDRDDRPPTALDLARAVEAELGVAPPTAVAELSESMLASELSRRRVLVDDAVARTRDVAAGSVMQVDTRLSASEPTTEPTTADARHPEGLAATLLSETTDGGTSTALATRDIEVIDVARLAEEQRRRAPAAATRPSGVAPPADGLAEPATPAGTGPSSALPDLVPAPPSRRPPPTDALALDATLLAPNQPMVEEARAEVGTHAATAASPAAWAPPPPPSYAMVAGERRAAGGLSPLLLALPIALIALGVGGFLALRSTPTSTADGPVTDPARTADAREECDTMRRRIKTGGAPVGLSRRGWAADLWYRAREPAPEPAVRALAGPDATPSERELQLGGKPAGGRVVTLTGARAELAFDDAGYGQLVAAADKFFEDVHAEDAALVLRCEHLAFYDTGVWFRARDVGAVTASMVTLLGLFNDAPLLDVALLDARGALPFDAISAELARRRAQDPTLVLQKQTATVQRLGATTRVTFAPEGLGNVLRATRLLMEERGLTPR